ncbi:formyltransferase family protein [Streptomyces sp. NPDC102394]|uniref:formyltransferase family protein n=1 Tax=Streptomyces sp. NPDC102394 TaxID=3366167 RepID=UPI003805BF7B
MTKKLVFVTGHEFGVRALEGILASSSYLAGELKVLLTIGLDRSLSGRTVGYRSPERLAVDNGIRHVDTVDGTLRSTAGLIASLSPDFLAVIGWSRLVDAEVLKLPTGTAQNFGPARGLFTGIGMHPTCLPIGRGQAPIPWTIIKGLKRTALTVFFLAPAADAGPIIAQYPLEVRSNETSGSLFYRFAHLHFQAGMELAQQLIMPAVIAHPQDDALATVWPKRRPVDGLLRPDMTKAEVSRTVRALLGPYPRSYVERDGDEVPVKRAFLPETVGKQFIDRGSEVLPFPCADGTILLEAQEDRDSVEL